MKKLFVLGLCVALLLIHCACSAKPQYRDDLSCEELMAELCRMVPTEGGYADLGAAHWSFYFNSDPPADHCIHGSVLSEDINEIGILHAKNGTDPSELTALAENYLIALQEEKSSFIGSYAPKELPKLTEAQVRTFGNYVVFAILSKEDRELVFDRLEALLRLS